MNDTFSFPKPLSVGELLDRSFRLYRTRFGILLLTAAILLVPYAIISGLTMGTAMVGYMDLIENMATQSPDAAPEEIFTTAGPQFLSFIGSIFLIGMLGVAVNGLAMLSLTRQEMAILSDEKLTLMQGLRAGLNRLLPYIVMTFLMGFAILGAAILIGLVLFLIGFLISSVAGSSGSEAAMVGAVAGVMCLYLVVIFTAIYLFVRWSVCVPAMVEQNLGPIGALGRSWQLTKGRFWRTFAFVLLVSLLSVIIVSVPATILSQLGLLFLGQIEDMFMLQSVSTAISSLFSVIWIPLYTAAYLMYYYDLRVRNEGYDLAQRIAKFESGLEENKPLY